MEYNLNILKMKKSILNIEGVRKLTREEKQPIKGGTCYMQTWFNYVTGIWEWNCVEVRPVEE
ncbi:hypothetical protein GCM10022258_42690 [Aquimarina gracilis]